MSDKEHSASRYILQIIPDSQIALFHWVGPITLKDRRQNIQRMVEFCETHGVHNLIVDGRDQVSETGTMDSFYFGKEVSDEMTGLRIAVVHRFDDDSLPFIETVAQNRGASTKAFHSIDEARTWLVSLAEPSQS